MPARPSPSETRWPSTIPPRIALGYGPAGSGKTIGAQALNAEDPLSIYIRIEQKSGTAAGIANLIIDAMGLRGAKRGRRR